MRRRGLLSIAAAMAVTVVAAPTLAGPRERVEQPKYTVEAVHEDYEVRLYAPRIVAEVSVKAEDARRASNAGFRVLAAYIFGNNTASGEIAMTAPVGRSQKIDMTSPVGIESGSQDYVISFTMPAKWTLETLPKPNDKRVRIREVAPTRYAVRSFSGAPSERVWREREAQLRQWSSEAGYSPSGGAALYNRYDPPWVPWFARRNEIWIALPPPPS